MEQTVIRFIVGGAVVTAFAVLGDALRPKGFAGLFAAAPSVACASLGLAALTNGAGYAALEARSMIVGEIALIAYALGCVYLLAIRHAKAGIAAGVMLVVWAATATALYWGVLARWSSSSI
jgi:Protein of unknown function (DUF3147)